MKKKAKVINEKEGLSNASIITSVVKPMRSKGVAKLPDRNRRK
ncbi:MAG TPA: hypothetical protein VMV77_04560 [Bacteroidales bacterium]|nr:hypothetical protein [Bacteroidales bacterium]